MEAIAERACGLDVHQASVVACLLVGRADERPRKEVRTFTTTTADLVRLRDWLLERGCTHVGMESTGIYWRPVHAILEDSFQLIVGNAQRIRNVPGRKTDAKDSEWIADLTRHGLIASSFVPPRPIRELRDLLRYRRKLVESRSAERNRLLKLLETANIKIASVITDVFGVSGMLMLEALIEGRLEPGQMALLAKGKLRRKIDRLGPALEGFVDEHHRFVLRMQLDRLKQLDEHIEKLDGRIESRLKPFQEEVALLRQIPGVDRTVAAALVAEIGTDMTVFRSAAHLASWAGVCPGNHESAGKNRGGRSRQGNVHLKTALVQAAVSASKKKGTFLKDKFHRLRARRGPRRAAIAIAHRILIAAYYMLRDSKPFIDLGDTYLDQISQKRVERNLVRRLERLGYRVSLEAVAA